MDQTVFEFLFYMAAKTDSIVFGDNQYNLGFSDLYVHDFIGDDGLLCKASSDKLGACIINSWRSYIIDIETCIQFHKIIYIRVITFFRKCGVIQCGLGEVSTAHKKNLSQFFTSKKL